MSHPPRPPLARGAFGGALMGLANLVPGISGGTMLLAAGVYPAFIEGIAEVTTLRLRARTLALLAAVIGGALVAIVAGAGVVKELVVDHRWIMYSLFIGLTLGGVPILHRMLRPYSPAAIVGALAGLAAMVALALAETVGAGAGAAADGRGAVLMLMIAGAAGGSAMILPGVSGGYLLLVLGQYIVILDAISSAGRGASQRDWPVVGEAAAVIVPVGIGVVVGVVGVSNLIRFLLHRYEKATLGVLLGLLLGAVVGLWPFQAGVAPRDGDTLRGDRVVMTDGVLRFEHTGREVRPKHWPTARFAPSALQVAGALGLVAAGFAASWGIARVGRNEDDDAST